MIRQYIHRNLLPTAVFFLILSLISCKRYVFVDEIRKTDSLILKINKLSELMVIDDEYLKLRSDSIKLRLDCIGRLDSNHMNDELKYDLVTYKGFYQNYTEFLTAYKSMKYDNQVFQSGLTELRQNLLKKSISRKEFEEAYNSFNEAINIHDSFCRTQINNILTTEKMYNRVNPRMIELYEKIKKNCTDNIKN
ncbi:MAG TPA: hypothetical protein P5050_07935 [Bacteroidia bacterium]|nr:hypothetical protein [Sphingobacteriales bacterium]HPD65479.1 hypothetical protein [Bacteroidia bacterium]HRS59134.1 hypothetical protein [Bacteroidia bacterium]HRU67430.1 hypothetical protein [Bacteroidia bacterium]